MSTVAVVSTLPQTGPSAFETPEEVTRRDGAPWKVVLAELKHSAAPENITFTLRLYGQESGREGYQMESYPSEGWDKAPAHVKDAILALGLGVDLLVHECGTLPDGEDVSVPWIDFLRVGDWVRTEGGEWEYASLSRVMALRAEDPYQRVTVRWTQPVPDWATVKSFEEQLDEPGRFRVHPGHPMYYCHVSAEHPEHDLRYVYRSKDGEVVTGCGTCLGRRADA